MTKTVLGAVAGVAALFAAAHVQAAPVLAQGQSCNTGYTNCEAVAANRSDPLSINAIGGAFLSLGAGGSLTIDVTPLIFGGLATVIEVTNSTPNSAFPESAKFIFTGANGVVEIEINNQDSTVDIVGVGVTAVKDSAGGNQGGKWTFTVTDAFYELEIIDTTLDKYGVKYASTKSDGFDIDYLAFSTVPEPVTLSLLGMGLMGLGVAARRRRR